MKKGATSGDIKLKYVSTLPSNSPVCDVNSIGNTVEKLSSDWLKKCYSSPPKEVDLKDYSKCGNYDRILMRQWDYLKDSDSPVILYISYNGDGRVLVTKCLLILNNEKIQDTFCSP